jgi:threonine-phosphate decarboxylase
MLYGHGDNGYMYDQEIIADFSSNVWYGGEPAGLKEHLFEKWTIINKYPEVLAETLTRKVSGHHGLNPENILITSGTTESIYLMAQLHANKSSVIVIPSFAEYEDAARIHGHSVHFLPWESLSAETRPESDLFWLCHPNNPTGDIFGGMETLVANNPQTLFVIDEAFIEFTESVPSAVGLINRFRNLVILRSLTKSFAIPGLRLGYIVAGRNIIERLKSLKLPWSVNAFALEAGNFIFDHHAQIHLPLAQLLDDKAAFVQQLEEIPIRIHTGYTHFFLCETAQGSANGLQRYLLNKFRLLIRDAANFRGLGPRHFRLATLAPDQNQLLVNALQEWQKQYEL